MFTNILTMNAPVDRVGLLSNCAQSVLRAHGLNRECLHDVFNAVILAKLTYGASAWIGFTRASDRERMKHLSVVAYALNCVLSTQKLLQKYATIGFSTILYVIRIIFSTNYFPLSPQLQKTIILCRVYTSATSCAQLVACCPQLVA